MSRIITVEIIRVVIIVFTIPVGMVRVDRNGGHGTGLRRVPPIGCMGINRAERRPAQRISKFADIVKTSFEDTIRACRSAGTHR